MTGLGSSCMQVHANSFKTGFLLSLNDGILQLTIEEKSRRLQIKLLDTRITEFEEQSLAPLISLLTPSLLLSITSQDI